MYFGSRLANNVHTYIPDLDLNLDYLIMKRKFKQSWTIITLISTKRTITSHLKKV
jgi:hypothetical protein